MGYHVGILSVGCHAHPSPINLQQSVMMSCNAYYCNVFRSILDNPAYANIGEAFNSWRRYVESFGFGTRLE
jgi:penicillin-binding protein 2